MQAQIEARKLLEELKLLTLPVNLTQICDMLGIAIRYDALKGLDGYFIRHSETKKIMIVVNDSVSLVRQRFSVAHELGHIRLKHGVLGFSTAGIVIRREWMEVNANYFASELLMPKPLLQRYGYMTAEEISAKCEVSKPAASIRAEQLGWG